jgi:hypothetical protein
MSVVVETVVTTLDEAGEPNFAAMGVVWSGETITIRPFTNTRTYKNLARTGEAVVNVTDNVLIFAKSALSRERFDCMPAARVRGVVLRDTCYWREVSVQEVVAPDPEGPGAGRADIATRVVGGGEVRQFGGLCRAKHAVVEASILASRLRFLPRDEIFGELARLDALVEKTGGREEREAMEFIRAHVARKTSIGRLVGGGER